MNILDILILIPVAWFGFKGLKNGLIRELASMVALVLGVWVTFHFSDFVAARLGDTMAVKAVAFVLTFFGVLVAVHFAGILVEKVIKLVIPAWVNHFAGLLFGVAKTIVVISVILYFINSIDFKEMLIKADVKEQSLLYEYIAPVAPELIQYIGNKNDTLKMSSV